jgi:hypothetical protein
MTEPLSAAIAMPPSRPNIQGDGRPPLRKNGEPTDEADRGRHPGFARHEGLAGGPGSLSLSFGCDTKSQVEL